MKKTIGLALLALAACTTPDKPAQTVLTPDKTIIFIDKTQSVSFQDPFVKEKYSAVLQDLVSKHINKKGDQIVAYFVHENTAMGKCAQLQCRIEKPALEGLNSTDAEAASLEYDLGIRNERTLVSKNLIQKFAIENKGGSSKYTDLLASMKVLAEHADASHVYYFSDMVQSTPSQDFQKTPPTEATAEKWAQADAESFKTLSLGMPQIHVVLPFAPTASSAVNNPAVMSYWKQFFGQLGLQEPEIH